MNTKDIFYMIKREGNNTTSFIHEKYEDAIKEAERLSVKESGQNFYIMRPILKIKSSARIVKTKIKE